MKSSIKMLVLALVIVGMGTAAYAADLFIISNTINEGLNGTAMAVTPDGTAIANAAVPPGGPTDANAQAMMPNGGAYILGPSSGLTTNFNQTGVANAFAYNAPGVGPFMFPAGSPGDVPQGATGGPTGMPVPSAPGAPSGSVDQLVSKYTASSGFAQNFHDVFKQGSVQSSLTANPGTGLTGLTLEQGDTSGIMDVFKVETTTDAGALTDGRFGQLVQQQVEGPFSSCVNCLGVVILPIITTQRTDVGPNFQADTVSHPGP